MELDIVNRQFQSMKPFVPVSITAAATNGTNPIANPAAAAVGGVDGKSNAGNSGKVISTAEANAIIAMQERVDRQKFRDLLSVKFGMTESLIMDRG